MNSNFIHYRGKESQLLNKKNRLDLFYMLLNYMGLPVDNFGLKDIATFFSKYLCISTAFDSKYFLSWDKKVTLGNINYLSCVDENSGAFELLKNMCKEDVRMLKFVYECLLSLFSENKDKCIQLKIEKNPCRFIRLN